MSVVAALLLGATGLYAGFQWTIRLVVYPQLRSVPPDAFVAYERSHQRLVSRAVAPLFAFFGVTAVVALIDSPGVGTAIALGCFVVIVGVTGLIAVPQHRVLSTGFDVAPYRRLLRADSCRLVFATLALAAALVHAVTS